MNNELTFLETLTVEQFKVAQNVSKIEIKPMPRRDLNGNILKDAEGKTLFHDRKDNKMFFTFGAKTGSVSTKGIPEHPMLSLVQTNKGKTFWLLHEESTGGAPLFTTF